MKKIAMLAGAVAIAGCATPEYRWEKPGGTADEFHRDRGQCLQAMSSVPLATTNDKMMIYSSCLQGKGWYSVEIPRRP